MVRREDVAGWAALVRLRKATERYVQELIATIPEVGRLGQTNERVGVVVDALIEATDVPPSMGSVTYLAQVLEHVELPGELLVKE